MSDYDPTRVPFIIPMSLIRDHLYENCPSLRRDGVLTVGRESGINMVAYLTDGKPGDVCGWCVRVWKARNSAALEATDDGG